MAWCEAAQKECVYLDDVKRITDEMTIARAVDDDEQLSPNEDEYILSLLEQSQTAHEATLRQAQMKCAGEKCGLVAISVEVAYFQLYTQNNGPGA